MLRRSHPVARYAILAAILLLGLALRLWGIGWGLHNATIWSRPHPDEWVVYWLFQWFGRSPPLNPCPHYPGSCFFDWGDVFPYLAYGFHLLVQPLIALLPSATFGTRAGPLFVHSVIAARIVSALLSALTILVAYRLGSRAFGRVTGMVGALLVALSAMLIQLAHFGTPDSATGLLLALTLLAALRAPNAPTMKSFALAGIAMGLATGSELHMALLAIPIAGVWLQGDRRRLSHLVIAFAVAAVAFVAVNPYLVVDFPAFLSALHHTLVIRTVGSQAEYQSRWAPYDPGWLYVIRFPLGYGVGFALAVWMLAGFVWSLLRRTRQDYFLLAWIIPYFLLVTIEPAKFMRYSAPLLLPLAILASRFAVDLYASRNRWLRRLIALAFIVTVVYTLVYDSAYVGLFASPDPRAVAGAWLSSHSRGPTRVAYEEIPDGVVNLPYFVPASITPCFSQLHNSRLTGVNYAAIDSYTREELSASQVQQLNRYVNTLNSSRKFALALRVHYVPTFLGLSFPIDASPHDWRYPSHEITIYRVLHPTSHPTYCYPTIAQATRALYVHH